MKAFRGLSYIFRVVWTVAPLYLLLNFLFALIMVPQRVMNVLIIKAFVEAIQSRKTIFYIIMIILLYAIIEGIIIFIKNAIQTYYNSYKEEEIKQYIKCNLYNKIVDVDISFYDDMEYYNKYVKAFQATDEKVFEALKNIFNILGDSLSAIAMLSIILSVSPGVLILPTVGTVLSIAINVKYSKLKFQENEDSLIFSRKLNYIDRVFYQRDYSKDLRVENISGLIYDDLKSVQSKLINIKKKFSKKYERLLSCSQWIVDVADIGMWGYLSIQTISGKLELSDFMSLSNAVWQAISRIRQIFDTMPKLYENMLFLNNIQELNNYKNNVISGNKLVDNQDIEITLSNVSFSYSPNGPDILKNISFEIKKNKKIVIVGLNGSGKSTLIKLLLRLYDPTSGYVFLNNYDYKEYNIDKLRELYSVVFQDYQYYSYTIAENILMGPIKCIDDEIKVQDILKKCGLYEKVMSLPNGINTVLTKEFFDEGEEFSGGEYQKLAIARSLAKEASVLIMDEPTSSLDPIAAKDIEDLIKTYLNDKTCIFITHRLSLALYADEIIVMQKGKIVEQGDHICLIQKNGLYKKMYDEQRI